MRDDLAKCTTERPRRGRSYAACYKLKFGGKVRVHPDPDHTYDQERGGFKSSARRRHWECKEFSDALGALRGNLRVSIGKRWDDVYSEFCRKLDRRGLAGYHIWTHLKWEIETKTYLQDGKVLYRDHGGTLEVTGYYVHPETGLVCYKERPRRRHRRNPEKKPEIPVPGLDGWVYRQFNEIWFRYRYEERVSMYGVVSVESNVEFKRQASKKEVAWIKSQLPA